MISSCFIFFFLLHFVYASTRWVSVSYTDGKCIFNPKDQNDTIVRARFKDTMNGTGWDKLEIFVNSHAYSPQLPRMMGCAEGYFTASRINDFHTNSRSFLQKQFPDLTVPSNLTEWMKENYQFVRDQIPSSFDETQRARIEMLLQQFEGLYEGYISKTPSDKQVSKEEFWITASLDDMIALIPHFVQLSLSEEELVDRRYRLHGSSSAFVKLINSNRELYAAQTESLHYGLMLRIMKVYHYLTPANETLTVQLSSYPGVIGSLGAFTTILGPGKKLAVMGARIPDLRTDEPTAPDPKRLPTWMREMVANTFTLDTKSTFRSTSLSSSPSLGRSLNSTSSSSLPLSLPSSFLRRQRLAHFTQRLNNESAPGERWGIEMSLMTPTATSKQYVVVDYSLFKEKRLSSNTLWLIETAKASTDVLPQEANSESFISPLPSSLSSSHSSGTNSVYMLDVSGWVTSDSPLGLFGSPLLPETKDALGFTSFLDGNAVRSFRFSPTQGSRPKILAEQHKKTHDVDGMCFLAAFNDYTSDDKCTFPGTTEKDPAASLAPRFDLRVTKSAEEDDEETSSLSPRAVMRRTKSSTASNLGRASWAFGAIDSKVVSSYMLSDQNWIARSGPTLSHELRSLNVTHAQASLPFSHAGLPEWFHFGWEQLSWDGNGKVSRATLLARITVPVCASLAGVSSLVFAVFFIIFKYNRSWHPRLRRRRLQKLASEQSPHYLFVSQPSLAQYPIASPLDSSEAQYPARTDAREGRDDEEGEEGGGAVQVKAEGEQYTDRVDAENQAPEEREETGLLPGSGGLEVSEPMPEQASAEEPVARLRRADGGAKEHSAEGE